MKKYYIEIKDNIVVAIHTAPIVDVTLLEISESELQYYRSKLGKELT